MSTVTINNKNVQEYINKQLIDPYSVKIDLNTTKTASDNVHRWITLADAIKGGYKFNFDYDINDKPTEAPTLPEVVVTSLPRMYSVGAGEMRPFNSEAEAIKYVKEHPKKDASEVDSNYLLLGGLGLTRPLGGILWNGVKEILPYFSANGWLQSTQAVGNTPAWLTPKVATAIDAGLAGSATGASINDMRENGPTVQNALGTTLGVGGLAFEAIPTLQTVKNTIRPFWNVKNQNNRQALSDLFQYVRNGQYRNKFTINPQTNQVSWTREIPQGNVPFVREALERGHPSNGKFNSFFIDTEGGTIRFNPQLNSTVYTSKLPKEWGGWGETYLGTVNGKTNRMVLTAPRTDQGGTNLNLPNTLSKDIMKDFWINGRAITKPGTYISGDEGIYPLGQKAIQTYKESGFWPAIKTALQTENYPYRLRIGLSPDSYSSILRQAQRKGSKLRWGEGFYNWNSSAVENKAIYDAFNNYKKGLITLQDYEKIFNDWAIPLGGKPLQFITNSRGQVIPIHPHPYIYIKRKGGKLNEKH